MHCMMVSTLFHSIIPSFLSCGFPQGCDGTERAPERAPAAARDLRDLALESTFGQAEMANENGIHTVSNS